MIRKSKGLTLYEILLSLTVAGVLASFGFGYVSGWLKISKQQRYPVEVSRIREALRKYIRTYDALPSRLDSTLLNVYKDAWRQFYIPLERTSLNNASGGLLPDGLTYRLDFRFEHSNLAVDAIPGQVTIQGTYCDRPPDPDGSGSCTLIIGDY